MNTEKLANEQKIQELESKLRESEDKFAQCLREKEDFIYIASHDLKAPLRKLSTFVERLAEKSKDVLGKEGLGYLQRIENNIIAMQSMIDGLSALCNMEAGDFAKCDLQELLNETIKELERIIQEKKARITVSSLPIIEGNPLQLKEVFKNLITNSIIFQDISHSPKIDISARLLTDEEKISFQLPVDRVYCQLNFTDNGIGFQQEDAEKIFKPFERLHGKSTYPGNGLGLAICKRIINIHSGILYATGKENAGSLFVLILPQIHQ